MTIAEYCIFGVVALYLLTIVPIKWVGFRQYDNSRPRDPAFYQDAIRARSARTRTASRRFRSSPPRCCSPNSTPRPNT